MVTANGVEPSLWRPDEVHGGKSDMLHSRPSFEQLVAWTKDYFASWHSVYPFFKAPDLLNLLEAISKDGLTAVKPTDLAIVRTVMSISLADRRQATMQEVQPTVPQALVFDTVAQAMAGAQFSLCQPASIPATQAALSIQLFLVSLLRLNSASRLGGLIVRMAFHLGLHRCSARFSHFNAHEAEIRCRIFWSIYSIERFLCQSMGLPLDIHDDDVDVCFPDEEQHEQTPPQTNLQTPSNGRLRMLTFVAKHARIRGLILELHNKSIASHHENTGDEATYVQAELARWCNEIQDAVEIEQISGDSVPMDHNSRPLAFSMAPDHCVFLLLLKYESRVALNRPVMASEISSASYSAALHSCISAAMSTFTTLKRYRPLPILWPFFIWSVWINSFILIYAASEDQLPLASALRYVESGKAILRNMAARGTSWPTSCIAIIDELTAAVREASPPSSRTISRPTSLEGEQVMHGILGSQRNLRSAADGLSQAPILTNQSRYVNTPNPPTTATAGTEDQEFLYNQLFSNTLSSVEGPLMTNAQFNPSVDSTWSYLR